MKLLPSLLTKRQHEAIAALDGVADVGRLMAAVLTSETAFEREVARQRGAQGELEL